MRSLSQIVVVCVLAVSFTRASAGEPVELGVTVQPVMPALWYKGTPLIVPVVISNATTRSVEFPDWATTSSRFPFELIMMDSTGGAQRDAVPFYALYEGRDEPGFMMRPRAKWSLLPGATRRVLLNLGGRFDQLNRDAKTQLEQGGYRIRFAIANKLDTRSIMSEPIAIDIVRLPRRKVRELEQLLGEDEKAFSRYSVAPSVVAEKARGVDAFGDIAWLALIEEIVENHGFARADLVRYREVISPRLSPELDVIEYELMQGEAATEREAFKGRILAKYPELRWRIDAADQGKGIVVTERKREPLRGANPIAAPASASAATNRIDATATPAQIGADKTGLSGVATGVQVVVEVPKVVETASVDLGGGVKLELIWIPAGEFLMGVSESERLRDNDGVQHHVTLTKGFWLGKYEVTQEQWERVMGTNPASFKSVGGKAPVEQVSWSVCQEFIKKLNSMVAVGGFRLPTEAEWEYACRTGTTTFFYTGDGKRDLDAVAWHGNNSENKTHPVGEKEGNDFGLFDMHGNVGEWCQDWLGAYPAGAVTNPVGPETGTARVVRGGGWYSFGGSLRSAARKAQLNAPYNYVGLRLARSL